MSAFDTKDIKTTADSSWKYPNSLFINIDTIIIIPHEVNCSEVDDNFFEFKFNKLTITQ